MRRPQKGLIVLLVVGCLITLTYISTPLSSAAQNQCYVLPLISTKGGYATQLRVLNPRLSSAGFGPAIYISNDGTSRDVAGFVVVEPQQTWMSWLTLHEAEGHLRYSADPDLIVSAFVVAPGITPLMIQHRAVSCLGVPMTTTSSSPVVSTTVPGATSTLASTTSTIVYGTPPIITRIDPPSLPYGYQGGDPLYGVLITIYGGRFTNNSRVFWDGREQVVSFRDISGHLGNAWLQASIDPQELLRLGDHAITVYNPPGSEYPGTSNGFAFEVTENE